MKISNNPSPPNDKPLVSSNFITDIIDNDLNSGKVKHIVTRFPPEPNGYAHLGHAIASYINFGLAKDYVGICNLRFDDTNPESEKAEYAEALAEDLRWLGWDWGERLYYVSDYFEQLYALAIKLIKQDKAYVDSSSLEEIQSFRGTVTEPGKESPYRNRSTKENLELFQKMRQGEFPEGSHVLRAKIDMAAANMKLRDPILYRIIHAEHYRTGNDWHIYPMYDFAHPLSDAIEGISHSLCSLEFVENRAVYDWLVGHLFPSPHPHQYEFGRRSLEYTVVSKRKLVQLIEQGFVKGWDDPRMPTLAGLRRRGVRPSAIRDFASRVGISRTNRRIDIALLEHSVRDDLNHSSPRIMGILEPLTIQITNYPEDKTEALSASYWPPDVAKEGNRDLIFSKKIYIERKDFSETPPKGFKRLSPGSYVRLRHAYIVRCDKVIRDDSGIKELHCSFLPDSLGANPDGIKVKGAIHWLSALNALPAEIRLYDRLFKVADPETGPEAFTQNINPDSLSIKKGFVEASIQSDPKDTRYQFERMGYFWQDSEDSSPLNYVFNQIISLKDSWGKNKTKAKQSKGKKKQSPAKGPSTPASFTLSDEQQSMLDHLQGLGLPNQDAGILVENFPLVDFFKAAYAVYPQNPKRLSQWIVNDIRRELKGKSLKDLGLEAASLAQLVELVDTGKINNLTAKDVFADMLKTGKSAVAIVKEKNLEQVSDHTSLLPLVTKLLEDYPDKVEAFKAGKTGLMGFFVGQIMRQTQGKADPQLLKQLLEENLAQGKDP